MDGTHIQLETDDDDGFSIWVGDNAVKTGSLWGENVFC